MSEDNGGMGFFEWLILALIVLGLMGIGPCASTCRGCGPQPSKHTVKIEK